MAITYINGEFDYVIATVDEDGISIRFRVDGDPIPDSTFLQDEYAMDMSAKDVRLVVADALDIRDGHKEIEVIFE